jgi:uncharacterized protein YjdB
MGSAYDAAAWNYVSASVTGWESSNTGIFTVSGDGTITGVSAGSATLTVTYSYPFSTGAVSYTDTATITVKERGSYSYNSYDLSDSAIAKGATMRFSIYADKKI